MKSNFNLCRVDSPLFKTLTLNRPKLYQSFKNNPVDARHIASSMSPVIPKSNPFIVAKAATQFKGLLKKNSPIDGPQEEIFKRSLGHLNAIEEEMPTATPIRVFDRKNLIENPNNFEQLFSKSPTLSIPAPIDSIKPTTNQNTTATNNNQRPKKVVVDEDRFESDVDEF